MFDDFCAVIHASHGADRIFLTSSYEPAIEKAQSLGWEVLREETQVSESASVDAASLWCQNHGVTSLLRLPIDLPLLESTDVEWLFGHAQAAPSMTIVPSRDGTGTNALMRTPPTLFPSHFGQNSFPRHMEEAQQRNSHCTVLRHLRLEMDLDDESDLRAYLTTPGLPNGTRKWLENKVGKQLAGRVGYAFSDPFRSPPRV